MGHYRKAVLTEKYFDDRLVLDGRHSKFIRCRLYCKETRVVLLFAIPKNHWDIRLDIDKKSSSISKTLFQIVGAKNQNFPLTVQHIDAVILQELRLRNLAFSDLDGRIFSTPRFKEISATLIDSINNFLELADPKRA